MNCWPSDTLNCCAINRAMKSVPPPGANGTMIFTGLAGYCCARTGAGASRATAAASAAQELIALNLRISVLPGVEANRNGGPTVDVERRVVRRARMIAKDGTPAPARPHQLRGKRQRIG